MPAADCVMDFITRSFDDIAMNHNTSVSELILLSASIQQTPDQMSDLVQKDPNGHAKLQQPDCGMSIVSVPSQIESHIAMVERWSWSLNVLLNKQGILEQGLHAIDSWRKSY